MTDNSKTTADVDDKISSVAFLTSERSTQDTDNAVSASTKNDQSQGLQTSPPKIQQLQIPLQMKDNAGKEEFREVKKTGQDSQTQDQIPPSHYNPTNPPQQEPLNSESHVPYSPIQEPVKHGIDHPGPQRHQYDEERYRRNQPRHQQFHNHPQEVPERSSVQSVTDYRGKYGTGQPQYQQGQTGNYQHQHQQYRQYGSNYYGDGYGQMIEGQYSRHPTQRNDPSQQRRAPHPTNHSISGPTGRPMDRGHNHHYGAGYGNAAYGRSSLHNQYGLRNNDYQQGRRYRRERATVQPQPQMKSQMRQQHQRRPNTNQIQPFRRAGGANVPTQQNNPSNRQLAPQSTNYANQKPRNDQSVMNYGSGHRHTQHGQMSFNSQYGGPQFGHSQRTHYVRPSNRSMYRQEPNRRHQGGQGGQREEIPKVVSQQEGGVMTQPTPSQQKPHQTDRNPQDGQNLPSRENDPQQQQIAPHPMNFGTTYYTPVLPPPQFGHQLAPMYYSHVPPQFVHLPGPPQFVYHYPPTGFNGRDFMPPKMRLSPSQAESRRNLFVFHIPIDKDEKWLFNFFRVCGTIRSVKIVLDDNNRSKGYGFVMYERQEDADNAILHLDNAKVDHKYIKVFYKTQKRDGNQKKKKRRN